MNSNHARSGRRSAASGVSGAVRRPAKTPLAEAVGALMLGASTVAVPPARAELPVPSQLGLVAPGQGAVLPPIVNGNTMTIKQLSERATLDWASFNIGPQNAVRFQQPAKTSIALNQIHDSRPSQILGSLTANGQVYLVNQNGFLFGPEARVNTNSLVVSTLNISQDALRRGLSKVLEIDGSPALQKDPSLTGKSEVYRQNESGQWVKRAIEVAEGAQIKSQSGGRIMMFAPSIENRGSLSAPDGQAILSAATDKVYLQEANSETTGMRGLLVEVATGGDVTNLGKIAARRGNVTLEGFAVNQNGLVSATTSVRLNGSVRLLAREKGSNPVVREGSKFVLKPDSTSRPQDLGDGLGTSARVSLGQASLTQVDLERGGGETAVDGQAQNPGRIEIMGRRVELRESSAVVAPSGKIAVAATANPQNPDARVSDPEALLEMRLGARIDASGVKGVKVPVSRNVVEVELRGYELRDAPLQKDKNGALYGKKVLVDSRKATNGRIPLADISGAINRIQRGVDERSVQGGSVSLASSGETRIGLDASVDVSGGSIDYQGGIVNTTVLTAGGRHYDIGTADPNRRYDGIFGQVSRHSQRWNVTRTWDVPGPTGGGHFEQGYQQGADGGSITIRTDSLQLEGQLKGQTTDGPFQRSPGERAAASALDIELGYSFQNVQSVAIVAEARNRADQLLGLGNRFQGLFKNPLVLADHYLARTGFGSVHVGTRGVVAVAEGADLRLPAGGNLNLEGQQLEVAGGLSVPAGQVHLQTRFDQGPQVPGADGSLRLAGTARIEVSGLWANDLEVRNARRGGPPIGLALIDGGSVTASADGNLSFDAGAEIAADGGAWLDARGKLKEGKGGSVSLAAQRGSNAASLLDSANLNYAGAAHAYGLRDGGSLSLTSNEVLIGSSFANRHSGDTRLFPLILPAEFLTQGGFDDFRFAADLKGIELGYDTTLRLQNHNYVLRDGFQQAPTGGTLAALADVAQLEDGLRHATDLSLELKQAVTPPLTDAALRLNPGSRILGDAGARVTLQSDSQILMDGEVSAPAGTISVQLKSPEGIVPYLADQGIFLGPEARLSAAGTTLPRPGGRNTILDTRVLDGGSVRIEANRGYIALDRGSILNVSGVDAPVDRLVPDPNRPGHTSVRSIQAGSAGRIRLAAPEGIFAEGSLQGRADRQRGAEGGSLELTLGRNLRGIVDETVASSFPNGGRVVEVRQGAAASGLRDWTFGGSLPQAFNGLARLDAKTVMDGGFDSLTLATEPVAGDQIRFLNDVALTAGRALVLDTPAVSLALEGGHATSSVQLDALYMALGAASAVSARPPSLAGSGGPGTFSATARDLEVVGSLRLLGSSDTRIAAEEDLRLRGVNISSARDIRGELQAYGNLTLAARQIYPSTLTQFDVKLAGPADARLTVLGNGRPAPVLSAGGILNVEAPNIDMGGAIEAPFGAIKLTATGEELNLLAGSTVSVSGRGKTIPFGLNQGGIDWVYPLPSQIKLLYGFKEGESLPPEGSVDLKGPRIDLAAGSKVDLTGGGQLYSREFLKNTGGSVDLLDPLATAEGYAYQTKYAILPWLRDRLAPYDPIETPKSGLAPGASIILADAANGLAAGRYTLLPAAYALLPGAYLISPDAGTVNAQPGRINVRVDGTPVVAGRSAIAGSGYRDFDWTGFAVETGAQFRSRTAYADYRADTYFAAKAASLGEAMPYLPRDAAAMHIEAGQALSLDGTVQSKPARGGVGGRVDIAADSLRVVRAGDEPVLADGQVGLRADQLNRLQVESLLLGGRRGTDSQGQKIAVRADRVTVDPNASLLAPELMIAANERIDVKTGARIEAAGTLNGQVSEVRLTPAAGADSGGAFLRVAAGGPMELRRDQSSGGTAGSLSIESGTTLKAAGAIALDASGDARMDGRIDLSGGSLWLGAGRINLGSVPLGAAGLGLTGTQLAALDMDRLVLRSGSEIDAYGSFTVQAGTLDIRAQGLRNAGSGPATARFTADTVRLANPAGGAASAMGSGGGSLAFSGKSFRFGGGPLAITGFSAVDLAATSGVTAEGSGSLTAAADLRIATPVLTTADGADLSLSAPAHALVLEGSGNGEAGGLGGRIALAAANLNLNSKVLLPSGRFSATADDRLSLGASGSLDLAGVSLDFGGKALATPGGQVVLTSLRGDIDLASGSTIDVAGSERAGSLSIAAPQGTANLRAAFSGKGGEGAALAFDLGQASDGGAGALAYLTEIGQARSFDVRLHRGDLAIAAGQPYRAGRFDLSADTGSVNVAGALDASGPAAGRIALSAGDRVQLDGTAQLLARAQADNAPGGHIFLNASDQDGDTLSGVVVDAGAVLDVRGGRRNDPAVPLEEGTRHLADGPFVIDPASGSEILAGDIHLRGLRDSLANGGNLLGIDFRGAALGAETVVGEGVRVYRSDIIDAARTAAWKTETDAYMAAQAGVARPGLTLVPGLEILGSGDLTLTSDWNFLGATAAGHWRYGGAASLPGYLSLRAAGNLNLQAKLSDGLATGVIRDGQGGMANLPDAIQSGRSWNFTLVAGSDAAAANPLAVRQGSGDLTVGATAMVRTGTGDIALRAGRNLSLASADSAVYTVGQVAADDTRRYGAYTAYDTFWNFYAEYPTRGGDIDVAAGGDIVGAASPQFVPDWLVRTGSAAGASEFQPVAWGIAITQREEGSGAPGYDIPPVVRGFKQNLGALAGGDIRIAAGGSIRDLSAVIPTVGKATSSEANRIEVQGGGALNVSAGGDIAGGSYYVGRGTAEVRSGGAIRGGSQYTSGPSFQLGDARVAVEARSGLDVGTVYDPFLLKERNPSGGNPMFSGYSETSRIGFQSLAGDIHIRNDYHVIDKHYRDLATGASILDIPGGPRNYAQLFYYPASVDVFAPAGSIVLERSLALAPATRGNLQLLAGRNIATGDSDLSVTVNVSDADAAKVPTALRPEQDLGNFNDALNPEQPPEFVHAPSPVHSGDTHPVWIATREGDIQGPDGLLNLSFFLPKAATVHAGRDLRNVNFDVQNLAATDTTRISAQRDVVFAVRRNSAGDLLDGKDQRIRISGPGAAQIVAGRNIDLGSSDGLVSLGNTRNPALPSTGSSLALLAGLQQADPAAFLKAYGAMNDAEISALPAAEQLRRALPILFAELKKSGILASQTGRLKDYDSGYAAIRSLFPEKDAAGNPINDLGDINLFFSRVHTLAGGGIDLLAPGGMVNAGLSSTSLGNKSSSDLGIVVQAAGAINSVVKKNFTVNESRVFALGGGDITLWSSDGNIDAGRGAKSALSVPPPQTSYDSQGNLVVIFPPAIAGSGIQTASSDPRVPAGSAYLFAPRGVVDAGDAGISVGGNLTIGATAVLGAGNISVGGASVGVPSAPPPPVVPAAAATAGAAAAKQSGQQSTVPAGEKDMAKQEQAEEAISAALKTIQVDLVGFGECSVGDARADKEGCGG